MNTDPNAQHELVFVVNLKTTAKPEKRRAVAEKFAKEIKLQFGSAASIEWRNPENPNPTTQEPASHAAAVPSHPLGQC